jgi:hypothetical protein
LARLRPKLKTGESPSALSRLAMSVAKGRVRGDLSTDAVPRHCGMEVNAAGKQPD